MEIHQLVQGFGYGDATSNMAVKLRSVLRGIGYESSEIFSLAENIGADRVDECRDHVMHRDASDAGNILIYHYGNASPLSDYFRDCPDRKVLIYHNITPPCYFRAIHPARAANLEKSREDLGRLRDCTDLGCAISGFNARDLEALGFGAVVRFPLWIDRGALSEPAVEPIRRRLRDGHLNIVFVGRVAPNKKIEDIILTFHHLTRRSDALRARLVIAGSIAGMELYWLYLLSLCRELGLEDVVFTGQVSQRELNTYYAASDAFLCASEHEGFCIPLLEAAHFGKPVFAFDIPGVRETLGGAGVLFRRRDFRYAAEIIRSVMADGRVVADIVRRQRTRLQDFDESHIEGRLRQVIARVNGQREEPE